MFQLEHLCLQLWQYHVVCINPPKVNNTEALVGPEGGRRFCAFAECRGNVRTNVPVGGCRNASLDSWSQSHVTLCCT
jgi:hypothetical protein